MVMFPAEALLAQLQSLADSNYAAFQRKLIPQIPPEKILGIRMPVLRRFAKEFAKTAQAAEFLNQLPHKYYDENNLHGFLIEGKKDFQQALAATERFLPYLDNWATCDCFSPPVFRRYPEIIHQKACQWVQSKKTYTIRYGIVTMMRNDLDNPFFLDAMEQIAAVQSEEYYVNMAIAWFFSTALAKNYTAALPYLQDQRLLPWVHQKTIQKARESLRLSPEQKQELAALRLSNLSLPTKNRSHD